jgi:hypothetical protein
MLPVSDAFLAALRSSHRVVSRALIITPGSEGAGVTGTALDVVSGSVVLDGAADVRATLDLAVRAQWPDTYTTADLVPYGTEVAVSRGIVFGNGNVERAPLGIFRLDTVEQDDAPTGIIRLTGRDRMAGLIDARLVAPVQYTAATTYGSVLEDLVTAVYPAQTIEWDDASDVEAIGRAVVAEQDRYGFLRDLVKSLGKIFYYDYRGVLVVRDAPDPEAVVWEVDAGANGVLVRASRSRSRDGVYNAVVATGEALDSAPPPTGYAFDVDPASVTYWLGDFGQVPTWYSSPFITTTAQARRAAAGALLGHLGLPYEVSFTSLPNPALEPLDAVQVTYPPEPGRHPTVRRETHQVDRLTIGLGAGELMAAATRVGRSRATIGEAAP